MTFGIINKDHACSVCGKKLKKQRRDANIAHCCSACCNLLGILDRKAKKIFGV